MIIVRTITEIVNKLILCFEKKLDINLTQVKKEISSKNSCPRLPKLVEIISAIPDEYKTRL